NGYGLYDVAGNVWEWCLDKYDSSYYDNSPAENPLSTDYADIQALLDNYDSVSSSRVLRGGSWGYDTSSGLRVAYRLNFPPNAGLDNFGFRCVSGLNFTSGPSAGGVFTSGEAAPLLPSDGETGFNWFADLSLDPADYTWAVVDASSATLLVRLFVQPLGGVDASAWDFSAISTVSDLADQLGSAGLNLV
ncbi:MAG: SUMF1/EgtB/PvdO family nonheme iron enzyme, partial [Candidatus Poribacteria bacterium]|nr:SUMF1/EgtB/PvdO family nonheme iron enzyme [Candidatus Poribacteria bacterium]